MNFFKKNYILLILLIITCLLLYNNYPKNKRKEELINQSDKIEKCIDIENKNKRSIYENIKLSEYCIDNFGTIKLSQ